MKIFVTRRIPGEKYFEELKALGHTVTVSPFDRPLTPQELIDGARGADALLSLLTDKIDGGVMDAIGPQFKVISNYAVGYDNINIGDATSRGIVVANAVSEESSEAVAEHTWALLLALTRRIVESDESIRHGSFRGWDPNLFLGTKVVGKTLGLVGLGRIGSRVARRARGYNMTVLYNKHEPDRQVESELGIKYVSFDELLRESDFVSIHTTLNSETQGLFKRETFAKMKKGAYLINTARGMVVQEDALVEFLQNGDLAGAALDVFENEPNIHPELLERPNVITTPHIASATPEARNQMSEVAVKAIVDAFSNKEPDNLIDKSVWQKRRS